MRAAAPSVTWTFTRLKLSLLRNGLRQSSGRTAAFVISIVLVLLLGAGQLLGLILLRGSEHAAAGVVPLAALMALGWAVMPVFFPSGDETLDPTRLVMLPLRARRLMPALLIASLVGIGPLFTVLVALGAVLALAHGAAGVVAAVIALPLLVLVCLALARAVAAVNVRLLTSRRGRDLALLSGLVIAVGVQLLNLGVQRLSDAGGLSALEPVADVLAWVPPASAVAAVQSAGEGAYGPALAQVALSAAALAVLLWWWFRSLDRLMTSPDASTVQAVTAREKSRGRTGRKGLTGLLPHSRTGAVMLRTLRYAWRDPKTKVGWASSLGVGILLPAVFAAQGNGSVYNACWVAGLLGIQMYNQFGQDYSGFWLVASTISSARDAYVETRARMLAIALIAVPYVTAVVVAYSLLLGEWQAIPEVLGLALGLLGVLMATGVYTSYRFPYSIPQDSGYKNVAPGQGSLAYLSIFGGMAIGALLCAPLVALTIWLHLSGGHAWLWALLPVGLLYGFSAPALALRGAAPRVAARLPEILTAVSRG
ncbi:transporter [Streptomyces abyssalis]|uniref:Transporter n=1 Tax=Streptomyces abyssalis TaxID=933944 RepID=A0A1E7JKS1_9ACTN|nr:transporter [Streptomyces abyssalis]OEU88222.1 transporter [Streptomyces abyssalis]OEU91093.1 transporter [Streptomyces abyssalis]